MRKIASALGKAVVKPFAKKALQSGIFHAGDKLGKKAAEKGSDFIMKKLASKLNRPSTLSKPSTPSIKPQQESTDVTINRLISGSGIKRMRRKII